MKLLSDEIPKVLDELAARVRPSVYDRDDEQERAFITAPSGWPKFPILPVKRKSPEESQTELGLIFAKDEDRPIPFVIECNFFEAQLLVDLTDEEIKGAYPTHVYDTVDDLMADGWVVD